MRQAGASCEAPAQSRQVSAPKVEDHCNRCACPVEVPFRFADEICGPHAGQVDGVCGHVPLCIFCYQTHQVEVAAEVASNRAIS